jgi:hypothetical protein
MGGSPPFPPSFPPYLFVGPNPPQPYDVGNIFGGVAVPFTLQLTNAGNTGNLVITALTSNNADYTFPGLVLPISIPPFSAVNLPCSVTATVVGADAATFTFTHNGTNSPTTYLVTATAFAGPGPVVQIVPHINGDSLGVVPNPTKVNTHTNFGVNFQNPGNATYNVTAAVFTGDAAFSEDVPDNPGFPFAVNPGDSIPWFIDFDPTEIGNLIGNVQFATDAAAPQDLVDVPLSGLSVLLVPVHVLVGDERKPWIGFGGGSTVPRTVGSDYNNPDVTSLFIFNGTLWDKPGFEKTLRRLEVFYANLGVCELRLTVTSYRPTLSGPNKFDSQSVNITIGDATADETERSQFFDVTMAGEILTLRVTRFANSGPCALIGFTPYFEDKGEKVEDV